MPDSRPLTVALLLDDDLDRPDGVQQYVLVLAEQLRARGHAVHLVAPGTRRSDLPHLHTLGRRVAATANGNRVRTPLGADPRTVGALLHEMRADVLHVQLPHSPLLTGQFVRRADPRTAVVGTFHIAPMSRLASIGAHALGLLERRELRRFDAVMAMSGAAQDFARTAFGLATQLVPMPVDLSRFGPDDEPRPDGPARVVFLGRLVERKGARELLAALAVLARRAPGLAWTAVVAGRGPLDGELRAFVEREHLAQRVSMPGFVDEGDKRDLLARADLVVLPATGGESFGISVVEALAAARGVVLAGDNPGYREPMRGLEGQLVDPADAEALAATLERWIDDPAARAQAATRQRAAAERFEAGAATDQAEDVYRAAVAART